MRNNGYSEENNKSVEGGMNRNGKTRRIDEKEGVVDERDQMKGALAVVEVVKKDESVRTKVSL